MPAVFDHTLFIPLTLDEAIVLSEFVSRFSNSDQIKQNKEPCGTCAVYWKST